MTGILCPAQVGKALVRQVGGYFCATNVCNYIKQTIRLLYLRY